MCLAGQGPSPQGLIKSSLSLMVRLDGLRGLFQPKGFRDAANSAALEREPLHEESWRGVQQL